MSSDVAFSRLVICFATAGACMGLTYALPSLAAYQPWTPGDPLPLIAALVPSTAPRVVEDDLGELVAAPEEPMPEVASLDAAPVALPDSTLVDRPPGHATPLVDPEFKGMASFYAHLRELEAGTGVVRVLHWGDSTIAADGITSTVRSRMQARFGDAGPGFLVAGMDPRWNMRADVAMAREGEWSTATLTTEGGGGRYGLGGIVSTASDGAWVLFRYPKAKVENPPVLTHLEVWLGSSAGSFWVSANGKSVGGGPPSAADRRLVYELPNGFNKAAVGATGDAVSVYGMVMETGQPGITWEALGVTGVGSRSFVIQRPAHIAEQVANRAPALLVVQLGGNETGYPVLTQGDGSGYVEYYVKTLKLLRAGAPESSCLVVTPLDQGTRGTDGSVHSKPVMKRLNSLLATAAAQEGCAYWSARDAMGGDDSIAVWKSKGLAWSDLLHLSGPGLEILGNLLADAIEEGYAQWRATGGM